MSRSREVVGTICRLVRVAAELDLPVVYTEQYPRGLGRTVHELEDVLVSAVGPLEKMAFDCAMVSSFTEALERTGRRQVVLLGMESHICVLQTALHLLEDGYRVHVVADAVCSASELDHAVALERMRSSGVQVTTSETVMYEALGEAGTEQFRRVLEIVKEKDVAE
ncbi:MAG: isochorismatase family protein [Coriobacteriia bacterium]|nr:isochorismatase family protein [Coriobacteriia bacterium]